jgi:hypothetical protein
MDERGDSAHLGDMKAIDPRFAALAAVAGLLAACVPSAPAPTPTPTATQTAAPKPAPTPVAPRYDNWIDAPQTLGDWRYSAQGARTEATFSGRDNSALLRLRCLRDSRSIVLSLPESGSARPFVTIRTQTATRTIEAKPASREMIVTFEPRDPLLDAMAFARGRFAVESEGLAPLFLPSWAEVARVIEDCRQG